MTLRPSILLLHLIQAWDRYRLRRLQRNHPGLVIHPTASTNLACAEFDLAPGARLEIGPRFETDRRPGQLRFHVGAGACVTIGEGAWLRTHIQPLYVAAFAGATISLGDHCWLSGCHLSAKERVVVGRESMVGPGSRLFDGDQHDIDEQQREETAPIVVDDYSWISADVSVLKGVTIGPHAVVGAKSLVTRDVPPHTLAVGQPAKAVGKVGDRSKLPHI